jgi:hypothetical protein
MAEEPYGARDIRRCPEGGRFTRTVTNRGDDAMLGRYVKNEGKEYNRLHSDYQLTLFTEKQSISQRFDLIEG